MKAILCKELGSPEKLVLENVDDPVPGEGEVLVDIHAAGINYPDLLLIQGKYQAHPSLPFCPGRDAAGVVSALGEGVEGCAIGDRVIAYIPIGSFAEKAAVPVTRVIPMPASLDFATAAGIITTYSTSYHALVQRAELKSGETLLVLGAAGGVGLAAVELGRAMGAYVIAAASTSEKLAIAREAGADAAINYLDEDLKPRIKELTKGRGVDVVYDPVGGAFSEQALRATNWDGRFLVVGFAAGKIPMIPLNLPLLKGCRIVGVFWGAWTERDPAGQQKNFREILALISNGKLKPLISRELALEDYVEAFGSLSERRVMGKIVFRIQSD